MTNEETSAATQTQTMPLSVRRALFMLWIVIVLTMLSGALLRVAVEAIRTWEIFIALYAHSFFILIGWRIGGRSRNALLLYLTLLPLLLVLDLLVLFTSSSEWIVLWFGFTLAGHLPTYVNLLSRDSREWFGLFGNWRTLWRVAGSVLISALLICAICGSAFFLLTHRTYIGVVDTGNRLIVNFEPRGIGRFDDASGLAPAESASKVGFIDRYGRFIIEAKFEDAWPFHKSGVAAVKLSGKWGFIDRAGKLVIEPIYDDMEMFDQKARHSSCHGRCLIEEESELARVLLSGQWGFVDRVGNVVVEPKFDEIDWFDSEGFARVRFRDLRRGDKWGYVDRTGRIVIDAKFEEIGRFRYKNGLAKAKIDGKWGFIDRGGALRNRAEV